MEQHGFAFKATLGPVSLSLLGCFRHLVLSLQLLQGMLSLGRGPWILPALLSLVLKRPPDDPADGWLPCVSALHRFPWGRSSPAPWTL